MLLATGNGFLVAVRRVQQQQWAVKLEWDAQVQDARTNHGREPHTTDTGDRMPNPKKAPAEATPKKEDPIETALRQCHSHLKKLNPDTALKVVAQLKDYYIKRIPAVKGRK